jgi:hypothetical protein
MKFSPATEFRPHLGRLVVFAVLGALLSTVAFRFLPYLGPFLLICLLLFIVFTRSARERIATWGFLLGSFLGFFASWAYFGARATHANPIDSPITLAPKGAIEQTIQIDKKEKYEVALLFTRGGIPIEKLKELIGAMGVCKIGEACSKGVVVPIRWSLRKAEKGYVVASGEIESFESHGWSAADVRRRIGSFTVDRGRYLFSVEVLRDVPELATLRTRVTIYHPAK